MIKQCAIDRVCTIQVEIRESLPRSKIGYISVSYTVGLKGDDTPITEVSLVATDKEVLERARVLVDAITDEVENLFEKRKRKRGADINGLSLD